MPDFSKYRQSKTLLERAAYYAPRASWADPIDFDQAQADAPALLEASAGHEALREQLIEAQAIKRAILACLVQPHGYRPNWHVAKGQARAFHDAVQRAIAAVKKTP